VAEWLNGNVPAFHSRLECGSVRIPFLRFYVYGINLPQVRNYVTFKAMFLLGHLEQFRDRGER